MAKTKNKLQGIPIGFDLPQEWAHASLEAIGDFINGYGFNANQWGDTGDPIIRIQNLTGTSKFYNYFDGVVDERYRVQSGDLLISWSASLDAFIWIGPNAWLNQHIFKVANLVQEVDKDFLFYSLRHQMSRIRENARGSTMKHVTRKTFLATRISLPPLAEQQAIAHALRTVQRAKEATEKIIGATRQLKQSLMHYLFSYGPVPFYKADSVTINKTEIGNLPDHWRIALLGDESSVGNGSTPKRSDTRYWEGGTIPWLTSAKVHDRTINAADEFVTEIARKECHLPLVPKESLVIAITGQGKTLGNAASLKIDACVSQHLAYIKFSTSHLLPEYVLAYLRSRYDELQSVSRSGGSTKGALTCSYLKSLCFPVPPSAEQCRIVEFLSALENKQTVEERKQSALDGLFKSLLHGLMTGLIRLPEFAAGSAK